MVLMTKKRIEAMLDIHGFTVEQVPGFLACWRISPHTGRPQGFMLFCWEGGYGTERNNKQADEQGLPAAYMCIDPFIDAEDGRPMTVGRFRIPLVDWADNPSDRVPAAEQRLRSWGNVHEEFDRIFLSLMDLDRQDELEKSLAGLPDRYLL